MHDGRLGLSAAIPLPRAREGSSLHGFLAVYIRYLDSVQSGKTH